ncbi:hypothetical protein D1AOALGA4SA_11200 [Olavius algarvensis Delta 1 endosymbiont]|nr:hypothetical protein D1AOALGA4SA_11200 [Olavius algarvensis Delta 1 endosymbiont]
MPSEDKWERYFKLCGAAAAIATILGVLFGGGFGLYTYYHQKQHELALMVYNLKKDAYYELVDAATAIAYSKNKEDAHQKAAKFNTLYFGRAHIFVVDHVVKKAKLAFYSQLDDALKSGDFWSEGTASSEDLRRKAVELRNACREALNVEEIFSEM